MTLRIIQMQQKESFLDYDLVIFILRADDKRYKILHFTTLFPCAATVIDFLRVI